MMVMLTIAQCQFRPQYLNSNNRLPTIIGWTRGSYQCLCKQGFYSTRHPDGFNGTIMEVAYEEYLTNLSNFYVDSFVCLPCMEGCDSCTGPTPCLATYNWPFRWKSFEIRIKHFELIFSIYTWLWIFSIPLELPSWPSLCFVFSSPLFWPSTCFIIESWKFLKCRVQFSSWSVCSVVSLCISRWQQFFPFSISTRALLQSGLDTWVSFKKFKNLFQTLQLFYIKFS